MRKNDSWSSLQRSGGGGGNSGQGGGGSGQGGGSRHQPEPGLGLAAHLDDEEQLIRKRLVNNRTNLPRRNNDVYVTTKTNFKAQLARSEKLLSSEGEVFLHGIGPSIPRTINMAVTLKRLFEDARMHSYTDTLELTDNFDYLEGDSSSKNNSAMHVRLTRSSELGGS